MKAKEVIAACLGAISAEATRKVDPHVGNTEAIIARIADLLDALPDAFNIDLQVEVRPSGDEEAE